MKRIARSEQFRQALEEFMREGIAGETGHPLDTFIRLGARHMLQVALEREIYEFLGRGHYRRGKRLNMGYRNGYEPGNFRSAHGVLQVGIPQVRNASEKFSSRLLAGLREGSDVLDRLVCEMYARGLSTRDVEGTFQDIFGRNIISKSGVSAVTEHLVADFEQWRSRDLGGLDIVYLFLDGTYLPVRQGTNEKEGILCAYGITSGGKKLLIHMALGERESYDAWLMFLHDMTSRGLKEPLLVIHDGNPGLKRAIREVFPHSARQRCQVHKMRNILSKLPKHAIAELKPLIWQVFRAKSYEEGLRKGQALIKRFKPLYTSAMECLEKDLAECLTHLKFPEKHRRSIRSTNIIERLNEETKRRTKVAGRFPTEKSCLKLVYSVLMRASANWYGIKMLPADVKMLDVIRKELFGENAAGAVRQQVAAA